MLYAFQQLAVILMILSMLAGLYARIPVLAKARHLRVSACAGITSACSASIAAKLQVRLYQNLGMGLLMRQCNARLRCIYNLPIT